MDPFLLQASKSFVEDLSPSDPGLAMKFLVFKGLGFRVFMVCKFCLLIRVLGALSWFKGFQGF